MIFITQPRVGTSHNEIIALQMMANELGWDVYPAPSSWRLDEEIISKKQLGIPYGSQLFCEVIAQQMGWTLHQNPFDWLTKVPKKYLKRQVDFMTLSEAKKLNSTTKKFIKPADDKCFDAKVYEVKEFTPHDLIPADYPTLVSDEVSFTHEYRCFVKDGKCTTWSCYVYDGEVVNPQNWQRTVPGKIRPDQFLELVIPKINSKIKTVDAVIDVGLIKDLDWAVIETNPVWASGIYGCDPFNVLECMKGAVSYK